MPFSHLSSFIFMPINFANPRQNFPMRRGCDRRVRAHHSHTSIATSPKGWHATESIPATALVMPFGERVRRSCPIAIRYRPTNRTRTHTRRCLRHSRIARLQRRVREAARGDPECERGRAGRAHVRRARRRRHGPRQPAGDRAVLREAMSTLQGLESEEDREPGGIHAGRGGGSLALGHGDATGGGHRGAERRGPEVRETIRSTRWRSRTAGSSRRSSSRRSRGSWATRTSPSS